MPYTAKAIANFFIKAAKSKGGSISPLKAQKLVYLSHGWHLALTGGEPLIKDEYAEAWKYGPVFPSLYHEFKQFGADPIRGWATDYEFDGDTFNIRTVTPEVEESDEQTVAILNRIWKVYGGETGAELSARTHTPGSPWDQVKKKCGGVRNADISNDIIRAHYEELREKAAKQPDDGRA